MKTLPTIGVRRLGPNSPRVFALIGFGVLLLLVAIVSAITTMGSVREDTDMVEHTLEVQSAINRLSTYNERLETARRGYLLQPDAEFVTILRQAQAQFSAELDHLQYLVADNQVQAERLERISRMDGSRQQAVSDNLLTPATALSAVRGGDISREAGTLATRGIRAITAQMADEEARLLSMRNHNQLNSLVRFYVTGGFAVLLVLALLGSVLVVVLRYNRELARADEGLRRANEGLEDAVEARTAELSRANAEIQRFAYIVSHDLRSPLVNVLGFTSELDRARTIIHGFLGELFERNPELRDEETWLAVDEDLPEALDFIRKSTESMDRLINSILELSRQGRRQLHPQHLDMNAVVDAVVASLHQRAEDAGATVTVKTIPDIESDRIAVEQILSNLVENALKYLSPDRAGEVEIAGSSDFGVVHIDVIDNGRGIDPADHERVFDLFRRAGKQDQPGEGIGLANVRALAYRLGGTIELDSELDRGARFRLTLPAKFAATETSA